MTPRRNPDADQPRMAVVVLGAVAVHVLFLLVIDVVAVLGTRDIPPPPPRIELVDVEPLPPPPPPVVEPEPPPPDPLPPPPTAVPTRTVRAATPRPSPAVPPPENTPPPTAPSGGAPVISIPDLAPAGRGVPVVAGPRNTGPVGRGGTGGGTGSGEGTGPGAAAPLSVAMIKVPAKAKDGQDYFDAGRDYPTQARQAGIEGVIRVRLLVSATGVVTKATLLSRLGHGLDELALRRSQQLQFLPALDSNDKPVASIVVWVFRFALPE